jgi:hypothetical protein
LQLGVREEKNVEYHWSRIGGNLDVSLPCGPLRPATRMPCYEKDTRVLDAYSSSIIGRAVDEAFLATPCGGIGKLYYLLALGLSVLKWIIQLGYLEVTVQEKLRSGWSGPFVKVEGCCD